MSPLPAPPPSHQPPSPPGPSTPSAPPVVPAPSAADPAGRPVPRRTRPRRRPRRTAALLSALLVAALAVAGCSAAGNDAKDSSASGAKAAGSEAGSDAKTAPSAAAGTPQGSGPGAATTAGGPGAKTPAAPTYLVRTAELDIRTKDVQQQLDAARAYAAQAGGYAGDETTAVDSGGHTTSSVQLRVPTEAYDKVIDELTGLGQLLGRKATVEDVTGQVVDVESRIKSQQASVARVRALMEQAQELGDVVSLENELSTRESALEALEAQQALLKSRTNLATITLRLTEPPVTHAAPKPAPVRHDGFWTSVGHALGDGWHAFYVTVRWLVVALSRVLPFAAVAVAGWLAVRQARRRLGVRPRRPVDDPSPRTPDGWPVRATRRSEQAHAVPVPAPQPPWSGPAVPPAPTGQGRPAGPAEAEPRGPQEPPAGG